MPALPNRLGRCGTINATPATGGFVMRITPNRYASRLDADHTIVKEHRCRFPLDKTQQRNRQTDEWIAVVHLLNLVSARLANLCGRTSTLASFTTTQQGITQTLKCFPLLWLRCEQFNGTVEGSGGNLTTGLVMQLFNTGCAFRQHQESNLLGSDANFADGLRRDRESDGHGIVLD